MKNKKNIKKHAGILSGVILTGALAGLSISDAHADDLFRYDNLGTGSEVRSDLIDMNLDVRNSYSDARTFELSCGEGKCGEKKGEEKKEKKSEKKAEKKGESKKSDATMKESGEKTGEHKCGEGKCGEKKGEMKKEEKKEGKAAEHKCGEGKCG